MDQTERGPDDEHNIFNPFYSPDVKEPLDADWAAKRQLAAAVRELIESLVTCTSEAETLKAVAEEVREQSQRLRRAPRHLGRTAFYEAAPDKYQTFASLGYELNPLDGESNPVAAPMKIWIDGDVAYGRATMGWQYEGPPNSVHGGFVAALFDQFLGVAQKITGQPGVTGTLSIRYIKPTPLYTELKLVGRVQSVQGRKNVLVGEMWAGDVLTATCEGLFIHIDLEAYHRMKSAKPEVS
ncbi:MAG TPA: PaaI family thioesterase [Pseudomonadales bacterium]